MADFQDIGYVIIRQMLAVAASGTATRTSLLWVKWLKDLVLFFLSKMMFFRIQELPKSSPILTSRMLLPDPANEEIQLLLHARQPQIDLRTCGFVLIEPLVVVNYQLIDTLVELRYRRCQICRRRGCGPDPDATTA
jgi:hypothetical protein